MNESRTVSTDFLFRQCSYPIRVVFYISIVKFDVACVCTKRVKCVQVSIDISKLHESYIDFLICVFLLQDFRTSAIPYVTLELKENLN